MRRRCGGYWADLHGQSGETIGMGTAEDYFSYARDKAFVDMVGHQGNDFQITDAILERAQRTDREIRPRPAHSSACPATNGRATPAWAATATSSTAAKGGPFAAHRIFWWRARPRPRPFTPQTSCSSFWRRKTAGSSPMSADAMPTSNTRTIPASSARSRFTRPGARSNGCCTTPSIKAFASAWCAIATITKAAPAQPCPAPRRSALSAGCRVISCRN